MKIHSNAIELEKKHHNKQAAFYALRSETDYIWEVAAELLIFNKRYIKPGDKIIDMGCGPSTIIRNLISTSLLKKITYIGIDISHEMLKVAKKNIPTGKFILGDMSTVKLPDERANIIISLGGLHHSIDKSKTLSHWLKLLKSGGIILLREPTYEAFKLGEGESPMEEGIKIEELIRFTREHSVTLESIRTFNSGAYHLFNRLMIKVGLGKWQKKRSLWYPVLITDIILCRYLSFIPIFRGLAFAAIIIKP